MFSPKYTYVIKNTTFNYSEGVQKGPPTEVRFAEPQLSGLSMVSFRQALPEHLAIAAEKQFLRKPPCASRKRRQLFASVAGHILPFFFVL